MKEFLEAGVVVNTHGVHGDLKIKNYCDSSRVFTSLKTLYILKGGEYIPFKCTKSASLGQDMMLVHLEGCATVECAVKYKNLLLYAKREDIPVKEGYFFIADIIGLPVIDNATGRVYGKVTDVFNQGAQDLYEVEKEDKTKGLIPAVPEFINRIDINSGVYVTLIDGLL